MLGMQGHDVTKYELFDLKHQPNLKRDMELLTMAMGLTRPDGEIWLELKEVSPGQLSVYVRNRHIGNTFTIERALLPDGVGLVVEDIVGQLREHPACKGVYTATLQGLADTDDEFIKSSFSLNRVTATKLVILWDTFTGPSYSIPLTFLGRRLDINDAVQDDIIIVVNHLVGNREIELDFGGLQIEETDLLYVLSPFYKRDDMP